jgi:hypothetical protein
MDTGCFWFCSQRSAHSADKAVTFNEDTVYTFSPTDFAFCTTPMAAPLHRCGSANCPTVGQLFLDNDSDNAQGTSEALPPIKSLPLPTSASSNSNPLRMPMAPITPASSSKSTMAASFSTTYTATLKRDSRQRRTHCHAPSAIAVTEDITTTLSGISFADPDAGNGIVTATLTVGAGTLGATSGGGVTVGGTATNRTLSGTLAAINSFITGNNLTYTTNLNALLRPNTKYQHQ